MEISKKYRKMRILCKCQLIKKKGKIYSYHSIELCFTYDIYAEKLMRFQRYLYRKENTVSCAGNASECGL